MKKQLLIAGAMTLVAGSAMAGSNLAWDDCLGGGGVADRTVACTNSGSGAVYVTLNPSQSYQNVGAIDVYIDIAPAVTIGSWWNTVPATTRWGSSITVPASGSCPAWWAAAPNGGMTFQQTGVPVKSSSNTMRYRVTTVVAAGEEQPMDPGTEYFLGALS